jgi:hypothetical protein
MFIILFFCIYQAQSDEQYYGQYSHIGTEVIYDLEFDEKNITYRYLYLVYNNKIIENYFLVSGLEKNKIKFDDVDSKMISNFEGYLQGIKSDNGSILFKTTEYCLQELSNNKNVSDLFSKEYGGCKRFSTFENLGKSNVKFWFKKLYFTYRDFVDWL